MRKNKLFTLLFSFVIAVALWLYVVTNVSTKDDAPLHNIPVTLLNQEDLKSRGLMLVSGENASVSLQLYGNRSELWALNRDNVNIIADLSSITEAGVYELSYSEKFPDGVDDVTVRSRNPAKITVEVVDYAEKTVPVSVSYTGEMAEGLLLDRENAELDYNSIAVSGPRDVVERIEKAAISVDRTGLTETLDASYRYTLVDANGEPVDSRLITTNTEEVSLHLPVEHMKEIGPEVEIIAGGGATAENVDIRILPKTITVSGSEEALNALDKLVVGTIDLSSLTGITTQSFELKLPDNVTNQSGVTKVEVSVSFKGLSKKTFTISSFKAINLPEGLVPTVITQQVEVTVRGPSSVMANVTAENITATADYKDLDEGTVTVPLTITVNGFQGVGAVGKYTISVTLAPPAPTETSPGQ